MYGFFRNPKWKIIAITCEGFRNNFISLQNLDDNYRNINLNEDQSYDKGGGTSLHSLCRNKLNYGNVVTFHESLDYNGNDQIDLRQRLMSAKMLEMNLLSLDKDKTGFERYEKKVGIESDNENGTISIHIPALENSSEANTVNIDEKFKLSKKSKISKELFADSFLKYPFEFPRQQENKDETNTPEVAQFVASQKLLNPFPSSPTDFLTQAMNKLKNKASTPTNKKRNKPSSSITVTNPSSPHLSKDPLEKKSRKTYDRTEIPYRSVISDILSSGPKMNPVELENIKLKCVINEKDEDLQKKDDEIEKLKEQISLMQKESNKHAKAATSNYTNVEERRRQKIVQDEHEYLKSKYGASADEVISKLYNRLEHPDTPSFSPALTDHIFTSSGIYLNKSRKFRHELHIHGAPKFLASERKVSEEKKRIRAGVEFEQLYVKLKVKAGKETETKPVNLMQDPGSYAQRRLQQILDNDLYRKIEYLGTEELWMALTIDKAKDKTVLGMLFGNTLKAINSRYNVAMLGVFEADDSLFNIFAAFGSIFEKLGKVKTITLRRSNGDFVTLPVRWFYVADYKSEKAVAGIKSGNPKYPSIKCLSTMTETYGELDFSKKCVLRPSGFHKEYSQERESLAPFIPSSHFVPPPLHMTLGPGAALFDYLYEIVAKIDVERGDAEEAYHKLCYNPEWKKQLKTIYEEISDLKKELKDFEEISELYSTLLSSSKGERKLKPCSLEADCVVKLIKKNVPSHFVTCCDTCSKQVHRCCKTEDLRCPHCASFKPTITSGRNHLIEEQDLILEGIAEKYITIAEKEKILAAEAQKINPGPLTKTLEKVLANHGGDRKAFFQAYSGAHLIAMGNNLDDIKDDLPSEIKEDERITVILEAMRLFFDAKKSMKKDLNMSDQDIHLMKEKIQAFGTYMKANLPKLKPKQKGHLFLFEAPEFAEMFKTSSFFSDEAIESFHPLINEGERRIKIKECPKRYALLMKWAIDNNYYYDTVDCKDHADK